MAIFLLQVTPYSIGRCIFILFLSWLNVKRVHLAFFHASFIKAFLDNFFWKWEKKIQNTFLMKIWYQCYLFSIKKYILIFFILKTQIWPLWTCFLPFVTLKYIFRINYILFLHIFLHNFWLNDSLMRIKDI